MLPSSVDASSLRVFGTQTGTASGARSWSNANQTLTFTPAQPFAAGEIVLVNLSHDVQAADATPLRSAGYAFQFWIATGAASRDFTQIDEMSNRTGGSVPLDFDNDGDLDMALRDEIADVVLLMRNEAGVSPLCPAAPAVCRAPIASVVADAGGICGMKPCWKETTTGFGYTNRAMSSSGAKTVKLKAGTAGKATISFQGSGAKLAMPDLAAVTGPVTVQLHRSGGAPCFGATFAAPFLRSDATQLIDKGE